VSDAARTFKLTVQYDGTGLVGWQRQPEGTSVQGLLEAALAPLAGSPVTVHGAGRTDAGVHALAQVASASFATRHDPATLLRAINAVLPEGVRVTAAEEAPPEFHARFSAVGKVYEYRIVNASIISPFLVRYAFHVPQPLDRDAMERASRLLVGRHDFAAFQGTGTPVRDSERTVHAIRWAGRCAFDEPLAMTIEGDGFLRRMVRNIAGTIVDVGLGRWTPEAVAEILGSRDRSRAGNAAPAHGLFLVRVLY
jgi:tRNA pseudouridine38-40 synthase